MMTRLRRSSFSRWTLAAALLSALTLGGALHATPDRAQAAHGAATDMSTLSIGWAIETKTLDPVNKPQNPDIWVVVNIYDQLVRVGNNGATLQPDLATSWDIANGGKVYTFHLRPGVVFQNGQPLTAADVKFCLDRARDPNQLWSWTLAAVQSVDAPNASTVRVTLKHPWAPFLSDIALFDTGVYPAAYYKKVGVSYMSSHPIGTGPYALQEWKRGQYLRLVKNARYFMASQFPMQHVEYDLIPNDNTRLLKVEAGELDVDNVLPYNQIAALQRNQAAAAVLDPSTQTNYLAFNTHVAPFNDVKVRQAMSHAIDRASIVKAILYGYGSPANSFLPRGAIDYNASIPVPAYDLNLAKRLLAQSSRPHGFNMTMEIPSGNSISNEIAVVFKSEVAALGINVTIKPVDPTTLFNDQQVGKYNFTTTGWTNDIPDPDELVSFAIDYSQGAKSFYTFYNNPAISNLSHQAEQSNDSATRQRLYYQIQQVWAQDVPFLALYYSPFVNAVSSHVQGFHETPLGYFALQGVHKS